MLVGEKKTYDCYFLYWNNSKYIGDAVMDEDGYFKFFPNYKGGYYDENFLTEVLNFLKAKNKEWDDGVHEFFRS